MVKSKVASLKRVDPPAEDPWTHLLRDKGPKARASWKASKNDIPMVRFVKKCFSTLTPQERCSLADTLDHVEGKIFVGSACSARLEVRSENRHPESFFYILLFILPKVRKQDAPSILIH